MGDITTVAICPSATPERCGGARQLWALHEEP